ncbi:uncharacterized protein IUM83_14517 [Phytophthora cinnamomi]|uniref:uncharacterized protein n=1 Tax=Phytophthora cinnamomi TaxID=4785 RepID=UPI00355A9180|nr:hypothetical protein IUM83_14517 [Phytophthora cinnamomi]
MEAERAQWQHSNSELQQKLEELHVEQSKRQEKLLADNEQLQQQTKAAERAAKKSRHKYKKLKAEVKVLRGQLATQANARFALNPLKIDHSSAGRLRTLRKTKNHQGGI